LGEKVSRHIFKYVDVAKLLVKAPESMQEQQSKVLALSDTNGILHERYRNPLMTKIWMCHHAIYTRRADPGWSQAHGTFKQCIAPNIAVSKEGSTKLVPLKIGIKREEALPELCDEVVIIIWTKHDCIEAKERLHLCRRFERANLEIS
jgi:hypothetical protein